MKRILMSVSMIAAVAVLAISATGAFFSDEETSQGNNFTAGTLDLTLDGSGASSLNMENMVPGDSVSGCVKVKNAGSLAGWLGVRTTLAEADGVQPSEFNANVSAEEFAKNLIIKSLTYDTLNITDKIPDIVSDNVKTVYEFAHDDNYTSPAPHNSNSMWASYDVDMVAGEEHEFCLDVELAENADNNFMGDGVSLGLNFLLSQK